MSYVINSKLLSMTDAGEILNMYNAPPTYRAFQAAANIAKMLQPSCNKMLLVNSENVASRPVYVEMPTAEEWERLERAGVVEDKAGQVYVIMSPLN